MEGVSAGVYEYTGNGKTVDLSLPLIGVTAWEFIREMLTITVETVLNQIGNKSRESSRFKYEEIQQIKMTS